MVREESDQTDEDILANVLREVGDVEPSPRDRTPTAPATWRLPGFTGKSKVTTSFGDLPIEALRPRDALRTIDGRFLKVEWTDKVHLEADFLRLYPDTKPVLIRANAFGKGTPVRDAWMSRHQLIKESQMAQRLKTVEALLTRSAMAATSYDFVTYHLFHCGQPAMIQVDGIWCLTEPMAKDDCQAP